MGRNQRPQTQSLHFSAERGFVALPLSIYLLMANEDLKTFRLCEWDVNGMSMQLCSPKILASQILKK